MAGAAIIDITPDWPVALGGYGSLTGRRSTGMHDRILAKALYLESGDRRVALVTTDLLGSLLTLRNDVRKELGGDLDVILAASHTHSAPAALVEKPHLVIAATIGSFDKRLYDWYRDRLVEVIRRAADVRAPASISFGSVDAPEFCRNRRSKHYPDGHGPVDPALGVLRIGNAILVNYAAHATVLDSDNLFISGDWPGALQRRLEATGAIPLFTNGAEGDISPSTPGGEDRFDKCERMGAALAERALSIALSPPAEGARLNYVECEIELPPPAPVRWTRKSVVGVLEIGDAALICFPGEASAEIGLELKRRFRELGYRNVWIVGLANDHLFYALSKEQYEKGGYERKMSFYGPDFGPWMVERFVELVHRGDR